MKTSLYPPPQRFLELLKKSLLNELYLENEARILYIFSMLAVGRPVDHNTVREIRSHWPELVAQVRAGLQEGRPYWKLAFTDAHGQSKALDLRGVSQFSHTMIGRKRLDNLTDTLDAIRLENIPGDLIETGVWRGGAAILMKGYLEVYGMDDRKVWLADSFEGLPVPSLPQDAGWDFSVKKAPNLAISLEEVRENFSRYGLLDDGVAFIKGWFRDTLATAPITRLAVLRLDGDLYESTMDSLNALYDKVSSGGFIIVDDYGDFEPCRVAVTEFRAARRISEPLQVIDWAGVFWRKA